MVSVGEVFREWPAKAGMDKSVPLVGVWENGRTRLVVRKLALWSPKAGSPKIGPLIGPDADRTKFFPRLVGNSR